MSDRYLTTATCAECKKKFIPAPYNVFKIYNLQFCKWTCYKAYKDRKEQELKKKMAERNRKKILDKLKETDIVIELTGKSARGMGHGMCAYSKNAKYQNEILFIQTDEDKLSAFEQEHTEDKGEDK